MAKKKTKHLTESEWQMVFELRCKSKRGMQLTEDQSNLCHRAFKQDFERYKREEKDVFNATVPFGSFAKID